MILFHIQYTYKSLLLALIAILILCVWCHIRCLYYRVLLSALIDSVTVVVMLLWYGYNLYPYPKACWNVLHVYLTGSGYEETLTLNYLNKHVAAVDASNAECSLIGQQCSAHFIYFKCQRKFLSFLIHFNQGQWTLGRTKVKCCCSDSMVVVMNNRLLLYPSPAVMLKCPWSTAYCGLSVCECMHFTIRNVNGIVVMFSKVLYK